MAKILISMIFLFLFNSCAEDDTSVSDEMEVNVIRTYHDYYISSASGVKNRNHSLYVIGDDSFSSMTNSYNEVSVDYYINGELSGGAWVPDPRIKEEGKAGQSVEMGVIFVMSSNFLSEPGSEWVVGTCFKSPCVAAGNNELTSLFR